MNLGCFTSFRGMVQGASSPSWPAHPHIYPVGHRRLKAWDSSPLSDSESITFLTLMRDREAGTTAQLRRLGRIERTLGSDSTQELLLSVLASLGRNQYWRKIFQNLEGRKADSEKQRPPSRLNIRLAVRTNSMIFASTACCGTELPPREGG